jgi:hypothetical protein
MKEKKKQKQISIKLAEKRQAAEQGKQQLIELLLQGPENKVQQKYSDRNLDRENEIIELLGGRQVTIRQIKDIIAKCEQEYVPQFPSVFYSQIDRLNNWHRPKEKLHEKPPIVGRWTKQIIYGRFPKEVLPVLEQLNPYTGFGIRLYKHFQWLTPEGKAQLQEFIAEAIDVMQSSSSWYEFRVKYARRYGVPFQLSAFEDNDNIK